MTNYIVRINDAGETDHVAFSAKNKNQANEFCGFQFPDCGWRIFEVKATGYYSKRAWNKLSGRDSYGPSIRSLKGM